MQCLSPIPCIYARDSPDVIQNKPIQHRSADQACAATKPLLSSSDGVERNCTSVTAVVSAGVRGGSITCGRCLATASRRATGRANHSPREPLRMRPETVPDHPSARGRHADNKYDREVIAYALMNRPLPPAIPHIPDHFFPLSGMFLLYLSVTRLCSHAASVTVSMGRCRCTHGATSAPFLRQRCR